MGDRLLERIWVIWGQACPGIREAWVRAGEVGTKGWFWLWGMNAQWGSEFSGEGGEAVGVSVGM
jgi:hypothetical protein